MPVAYALSVRIAAHQAAANLIDAATGPGAVILRDVDDVLLSTTVLADPCGSVSGTTGALALAFAGPDLSAAASGTPAYAQVVDGNGLVIIDEIPVAIDPDLVPVVGSLVLSTGTVYAGGPVQLNELMIG